MVQFEKLMKFAGFVELYDVMLLPNCLLKANSPVSLRNWYVHREAEGVTVSELAQGLQTLGYKLAPSEVTALAEQVHPASKQSGAVDKSAFLASQLDWNTFMSDHRYVENCRKFVPTINRQAMHSEKWLVYCVRTSHCLHCCPP